jgi:hypothetical protein
VLEYVFVDEASEARANTVVDGRDGGRRKQYQDDMLLMAVDEYDFCLMAIDYVNHDSHEIQDSFFDRFTYESDNDYDDSYDSYDSTPFNDANEYDLVSMPADLDKLQEQVLHEWGMMTTEEVIMGFDEESPNEIEDSGSNIEDPGSNIKQEEVTATAVERSFQLSRAAAVGEATYQMGTVLKDGRDTGARESYVPACYGTIKNEDC